MQGQAEDVVQRSLLAMTSDLSEGLVLIDAAWRIVYANAEARRVSRIKAEDLNGPSHWELYPGTLGTPLETAYREAMELRQERRVPAFFYEPFQTWYELRVVPVESGIGLHYRDVTEVREAEADRDRTASQLHQVLEATTDGVVSLDRQWRFTYVNRRAVSLLAANGLELGDNLWERFPGAVFEGSPFVEHYYRAMNEGIAGEFEAYYAAPLNMWLRLTVTPSADGVIIFFRDATEQKRSEAALIQSEKLAAVGRLASSIAHEINNPLEAVTNLLFLARQQAHHAETQNYLDLAELELRRVSVIANQTLRFHKQATKPQEVMCTDLFASVLSVYEGRLKNARVTLFKRKRARRAVTCMEGEIRQVLSNLIGNAVDAMASGGRLLVRSREGTEWKTGRTGLFLTVADTGTGMSAETQAKIFHAFYTTKGFAGTGLGMWISAEIVARHEGRMMVRSSQADGHRGTVIVLFLPFARDTA